jgi:nucleotide-binding universal stress UspA family protein
MDLAAHAPTERGIWTVGLDGSDRAKDALRWATLNAPKRADGLQLVTAWQIPVGGAYPMASPAAMPFDDGELRAEAANEIEKLAKHTRNETGLPVDVAVGQGGPAAVLLDASTRGSLLVVGNRGRGGFARLLLGSTSAQCAAHAAVPTVVVPNGVTAPTKRIVIGLDGSPNAMAALRWAIAFAEPGSVVAVTCVWDTTPLAVGADAFFFPDASDLATERFHHLVESVMPGATARDVIVEQNFVRGTPRSALSSAAEGADLLVVGARGHGVVGTALLGSVSTWLLHNSSIPVAVVPVAPDTDKELQGDTT